tara:strand:- start:1179 stop:1832 length:654 start_codon:yes stop_codon:yes gene_type:complete
MDVTTAVNSRKSIRSYTQKSVPNPLIKKLLSKAARSPSGGNLQPWKIFVLNNSSMSKFIDFQATWVGHADPQYEIYPKKLSEPYRTSRYELGEQMYSILGISREMKNERIAQVMKNFEFFGAPAGLFCYIEKQMGPPQWSDLGMFLQTFMLLCEETGLSTCAQEAWSIKHDCVSAFLNIQNDDILFCGMSIGYKDDKDVINSLQSERRPIDEWATFI